MEHRIRPRPVVFAFPRGTERHWFGNSPFKTHWLNSYTLIIPEGEKFILRTTRRYLDQVDGVLREQVQGLLGQEALHSREHERFFENLRSQGYRIDGFVRWYTFILYGVLERCTRFVFGPKMLLSTASALEHINAVIAEIGLTHEFLSDADPGVRPLFEWHYAEEIEHKAVVYDVLRKVSRSYVLRVLGLPGATFCFLGALGVGTMSLLWQDRRLLNRRTLREAWRFFFVDPGFFQKYCEAVRSYLRPSFHPDDRDNYQLAEDMLARLQQ